MSRISLERAVGVETTVVDASGMGDDVDDALRRDCAIRIPPAEESDDDDGDEEDDCALIETLRPLRAGEELCLTYGNYGNYELLAGYGFTLDDNPFETALLCWEHVVAAARVDIHRGACQIRQVPVRGTNTKLGKCQ